MEARLNREVVVASNCLFKNYSGCYGDPRKIEDTDNIRGDLAFETFEKALSHGVRVVTSDGGSSDQFLASVEGLTAQGLTIVHSEISERAFQRRHAFRRSLNLPGVSAIVYTQPEKVFLTDYLKEITYPILNKTAEVIIPRRIPEISVSTYPGYMWDSEMEVNKVYDRLVGKRRDWFFGSFVFSADPEVADLFLKKYVIDGEMTTASGIPLSLEQYSGNHLLPLMEAIHRGMRVEEVPIPFTYPKLQLENETAPEKIEEFKKWRKIQGEIYTEEAGLFWEFLNGNRRSRIREVQA